MGRHRDDAKAGELGRFDRPLARVMSEEQGVLAGTECRRQCFEFGARLGERGKTPQRSEIDFRSSGSPSDSG